MLSSPEGSSDTFISRLVLRKSSFNPLNPNSDENNISLYIVTACSNIQVMRIEKMITKGKMS